MFVCLFFNILNRGPCWTYWWSLKTRSRNRRACLERPDRKWPADPVFCNATARASPGAALDTWHPCSAETSARVARMPPHRQHRAPPPPPSMPPIRRISSSWAWDVTLRRSKRLEKFKRRSSQSVPGLAGRIGCLSSQTIHSVIIKSSRTHKRRK